MKFNKIKYWARKKRTFLLGISVVLILLGILISFDNITKFAKGNQVYKADSKNVQSSENLLVNKWKNLINKPLNNQRFDSNTLQIENDPELYSTRPKIGDRIGELYIPKLDRSLPIYEGTGDKELDIGVGHYKDSVLPGENDNSVLAGHRDTVFRKLGKLQVGDSLIVHTLAGDFFYQIDKVRIVNKDDRTVIVPKPSATLTLSTCYPFEYIGSAPKRYILVAKLISKTIKLN